MRPFANEPILELRRAPVRERLVGALAELDGMLPLALGGGSRVAGGGEFSSTDPGKPSRVVAEVVQAGEADAAAAVEAAREAFPAWAARSASERAEVLVAAAAWLRERRPLLAALQVRECAKPWGEADGDVCEAIDFLEYYARGAVRLQEDPPDLIQAPGERNTMRYVPRGVVAVIAPWNFPLAIPTGMTAAGLAVGNAVVLKPAEQSPASAEFLRRAFEAAGLPEGVLTVLNGFGDIGAALVRDTGVHTIAFTGSSAVGLEILRTAAETPDDQAHVKRVVSEMGGKNGVIVDSDADLDEAVPAVLRSAFVYAGQKCSACSRVLAHEAIADALEERLAGAARSLAVGQAHDFAADVPPVIEREAQERVRSYAQRGAAEGRVVAGDDHELPGEGWFCAPTVVAGLPAGSALLSDEIFGPLVAVERHPSIDAACDAIDASPFALTGGLFSRNPRTVEHVSRRLPVGNLYVNRHITGAMVGRQPFGGNRRSGVGSKAGGPDYLLQFVEPRTVSENTLRQGFAPLESRVVSRSEGR